MYHVWEKNPGWQKRDVEAQNPVMIWILQFCFSQVSSVALDRNTVKNKLLCLWTFIPLYIFHLKKNGKTQSVTEMWSCLSHSSPSTAALHFFIFPSCMKKRKFIISSPWRLLLASGRRGVITRFLISCSSVNNLHCRKCRWSFDLPGSNLDTQMGLDWPLSWMQLSGPLGLARGWWLKQWLHF